MARTLRDIICRAVLSGYAGSVVEGFQGIKKGKFGVFRPIYAIGGVVARRSILKNVVIFALLEFLSSAIFDPSRELWDYSGKPLNIEGRICMQNTFLFALIGSIFRMISDDQLLILVVMCLLIIYHGGDKDVV